MIFMSESELKKKVLRGGDIRESQMYELFLPVSTIKKWLEEKRKTRNPHPCAREIIEELCLLEKESEN